MGAHAHTTHNVPSPMDVWTNDSTRLWNEPKNIWQELDVKKTERDKKWVREPDKLTTKTCKSVQFILLIGLWKETTLGVGDGSGACLSGVFEELWL